MFHTPLTSLTRCSLKLTKYSGKRITQNMNRKRFSTVAKKELTSEEKAAEVGEAMWPKIKRYSPLIVPAVLFVISSLVVINGPIVRQSVEEQFPAYVEFLREHYGFSDEDINEVNRLKSTKAALKQPVTVQVVLSDGRRETYSSTDGSKEVGGLIADIEAQTGCSVLRVTFPETATEADSGNNGGDNEQLNLPAAVSERVGGGGRGGGGRGEGRRGGGGRGGVGGRGGAPPAANGEQNSSTQVLTSDEEAFEESQEAVSSHSQIAGWSSSLWSPQLPEVRPFRFNDQSNGSTSTGAKASPADALQHLLSVDYKQKFIQARFENFVAVVLSNLRQYSANVTTEVSNLRPLCIDTSKVPAPAAAKATRGASTAAVSAKQEALMRIGDLEGQIQFLIAERNIGRREIDVIDMEIAQLKAEVTSLKRTHVNMFYYF